MNGERMKITVLLGGNSPERDVSLASGKEIVRAIRSRDHEAYLLDPALPLDMQVESGKVKIGEEPPEVVPTLPPDKMFEWLRSPYVHDVDAVFVGLHGGMGEDGTVQALLEAAGVPYTGTGVLGSALAMNKDRSKALFKEAAVQTAPHIFLSKTGGIGSGLVREQIETAFAGMTTADSRTGSGFPVVVKPNNQGSSVGFSYVPESDMLDEALKKAFAYGDELIIEPLIQGREITAAVLSGEPLPLVEIVPEGGFFDYKRKYTKGTSEYIVPAKLDESVEKRIKRNAVLAYKALSCRDYARVDFRLSEQNEPYCLEVNTLPGMTEISLVPMAADAAGISFDELVERICKMAVLRGKGGFRR